mmetsp:Transcript_10111/g.21376  ORF Transcript_10111/g.21376 Transcript_10111/m.21376 type:complete len:145 (+) Transcript_10111:68-502(+)
MEATAAAALAEDEGRFSASGGDARPSRSRRTMPLQVAMAILRKPTESTFPEADDATRGDGSGSAAGVPAAVAVATPAIPDLNDLLAFSAGTEELDSTMPEAREDVAQATPLAMPLPVAVALINLLASPTQQLRRRLAPGALGGA